MRSPAARNPGLPMRSPAARRPAPAWIVNPFPDLPSPFPTNRPLPQITALFQVPLKKRLSVSSPCNTAAASQAIQMPVTSSPRGKART